MCAKSSRGPHHFVRRGDTVARPLHGGELAAGKCGTTVCATGTGAYDSVNVRLQIRVPTNAKAFSYDFKFFSAEYQTYQCTQFNDYFLEFVLFDVADGSFDTTMLFDNFRWSTIPVSLGTHN